MILKCCYTDCEKDADWVVYSLPFNQIFVCTEHVGEVLDEGVVNVLYPLKISVDAYKIIEKVLA